MEVTIIEPMFIFDNTIEHGRPLSVLFDTMPTNSTLVEWQGRLIVNGKAGGVVKFLDRYVRLFIDDLTVETSFSTALPEFEIQLVGCELCNVSVICDSYSYQ
jgi:hypothetical protein